MDQIGMSAAYDAGGLVVGALADSLERAIGRADNRRAMLEGWACLCTPHQPDARFTTGSAMGRNKIIYGLSRVTFVIASADSEGGTWAGASEALRKGYGRVAVWTGAGGGPGNAPLVAAGGFPVEQPEAILDLDAVDPQIRAPGPRVRWHSPSTFPLREANRPSTGQWRSSTRLRQTIWLPSRTVSATSPWK